MKYYIISSILYITSSFFLYYIYHYYNIFISYALTFSFLNIDQIIFYIFIISFTICFFLGTYFSKYIQNKIFFIIIGIIYYLIGLILTKDIFNAQLTFTIFFLLKYKGFEYSFLSNILYFIILFIIVIKNSLFVLPIKNIINYNIQNIFASNIENIISSSQYQLDQIYMGGYIEAENILYQNGDIRGAGILLNNQNNVNQTFIEYSNKTVNTYIDYYNSTIEKYTNNIINSMYPELSFILSIVFLEIFLIFINIDRKIKDL